MINQFKLIISVFLTVQMVIISCSEKGEIDNGVIHSCRAFSDSLYDTWFPYNTGEVINFTSNTGSNKAFKVGKVYKSPDTTYVTHSVSDPSALTIVPFSCPYATVQSMPSESYPFTFFFRFEPMGGPEGKGMFQLHIQGTWYVASAISDTGLVQFSNPAYGTRNHSTFYPTYTSSTGKSYSNVQVIARDLAINSANNSISKIVIGQKSGLIAYQEYPSLTFWEKQ